MILAKNRGACILQMGVSIWYVCICQSGWLGDNCEIGRYLQLLQWSLPKTGVSVSYRRVYLDMSAYVNLDGWGITVKLVGIGRYYWIYKWPMSKMAVPVSYRWVYLDMSAYVSLDAWGDKCEKGRYSVLWCKKLGSKSWLYFKLSFSHFFDDLLGYM